MPGFKKMGVVPRVSHMITPRANTALFGYTLTLKTRRIWSTQRERSPTLYTLQCEKWATRSFLPAREHEPLSARACPRPTLASHVTVADNCIPFAQGVVALVTRRFPPFLYVWPREITLNIICILLKFLPHLRGISLYSCIAHTHYTENLT